MLDVSRLFLYSNFIMKNQITQKLKTISFVASAVVVATCNTGCITGPDAQAGTVIGGVIGAATGGIIGHQKGKGLEGAAIGGGIGAVAGNLLGSSSDQRNYQMQMRNGNYQQPQPQYYYQQPSRPQYYQQPSRPRYYQQSYNNQPHCNSTTITTITRSQRDCNNGYGGGYNYYEPISRDARSNGGRPYNSNQYY